MKHKRCASKAIVRWNDDLKWESVTHQRFFRGSYVNRNFSAHIKRLRVRREAWDKLLAMNFYDVCEIYGERIDAASI